MRWMRWIVVLLAAVAGAGWWAAAARNPSPRATAGADVGGVRAAMAAGRFREAARLLDAVDPRALPSVADRTALAALALDLRRPDLAIRAVERDAAGRTADTEAVRHVLAESFIRSGRIDEGARVLADLEKAGLKGDRWRFLFAMLSQARNEPHIALEYLDPIIARGFRDAAAHVQWAQLAPGGAPETERRLMAALTAADDPPRVHAALGRHLLAVRQPRRAVDHLERAVAARPWDRDARVDLSRACRLAGPATAARAADVARALVAEDPGDVEARIGLAESLAGLALTDGTRARALLEEAIAEYGIVRAAPPADARTRMMVLLGLARAHVELLGPLTSEEDTRRHLAGALAALDEAEPLDGGPTFVDAWGVRLQAELYYQRARALKRAGVKKDRDAVEWYEKAAQADPRHLEANWDLGLLYYDFFRSFAYQRRAAGRWNHHIAERERRGLPPLDAEAMRMVEHNRRIVEERRDRGDTEATPGPR